MMLQLQKTSQGFYEIKGSKFLSFLTPIEEFENTLQTLRAEHPKAVHFVTATRTKEVQICESFSDDGEPKGSSGVPTLNVLRGENLINVGAVSVRYFGGTLLGVGGLVRAYTQAIQEAVKNAKDLGLLLPYEELVKWEVEPSYALLNQVLYLCEKSKIKILHREFLSSSVKLTLSANIANKESFETLCESEAILLC